MLVGGSVKGIAGRGGVARALLVGRVGRALLEGGIGRASLVGA